MRPVFLCGSADVGELPVNVAEDLGASHTRARRVLRLGLATRLLCLQLRLGRPALLRGRRRVDHDRVRRARQPPGLLQCLVFGTLC